MKKNYPLVIISFLLFVFLLLFFNSCTKNARVKHFGGTATIELSAGQKLIHCTWKDSNVWYLTRPMVKGDTAITYTFQEKSNFGIVQGTYIIKEKK
jgi:hypothetical protein